jgi:hypothetical protein
MFVEVLHSTVMTLIKRVFWFSGHTAALKNELVSERGQQAIVPLAIVDGAILQKI